jgi:hypothetical protein
LLTSDQTGNAEPNPLDDGVGRYLQIIRRDKPDSTINLRRSRAQKTVADGLQKIRAYRFAGCELNVRLRRITAPAALTCPSPTPSSIYSPRF